MSEPEHQPKAITEEIHIHPKPEPRQRQRRQLRAVLILTGLTMLAEGVAGVISGSLALLSDALHMLTHFFSTGISFLAILLALREAPPEKTFRYWRIEVLAALLNGILLLPLVGYIIYEGYHRFHEQKPIDTTIVMIVGAAGLIVNLACARILHSSSKEDLNIRGTFLHMLADSLSSIGVLAAGVLVWATGNYVIDPIVAGLISLLILFWSLKLIGDSASILLEAAPSGVKIEQVESAIKSVPGVVDVHDMHLWVITSRMYMLTAHVVLGDDVSVGRTDEVSHQLNAVLDHKFDITHTCFQFEVRSQRPGNRDQGSGTSHSDSE